MAQTIKLKRSGTQNAVPSTSQLALGEVALNTYDGKMYIKKSVGGSESIVEIGGDATSSSGLDFTGNLNLADNVRIVIGDGNDLQIYHDGSNSYIQESGTGNLFVRADNLVLTDADGTQFLRGTANTDVKLYYANSIKFTTTSAGAQVSGKLFVSDTSNGLEIGASKARFKVNGDDTVIDAIPTGGGINFRTGGAVQAAKIDSDGRLLVNTTSSIDNLAKIQVVGDSSSLARITLQDVDGTNQKTYFEQSGGGTRINTQNGTSNGFFTIGAWNGTASSDFVRVTGDGRVGIGTNSPSTDLDVVGAGRFKLEGSNSSYHRFLVESAGDADYGVYITSAYSATMGRIGALSTSDGGTDAASINFESYGQDLAFRTGRDASNAERMRIDSSGRVLIGRASSIGNSNADDLEIGNGSGAHGITIMSQNTHNSNIFFADNDNNDAGSIRYNHTNNRLEFHTNRAERMRIDSSGNVMVGATTADAEGITLRGDSHYLKVVRNGAIAAYFDRKTSDGTIVDFRKDGSTVGSIGTSSGDLIVGTGNTGLLFYDASPQIIPRNTTGANVDATVDLGASGSRFKDLYLAGTIYGGSTLTLDPSAHGDNTGTVVIAGNLQVDGTTTTINSTTLTVDDKNITLASGSTNGSAANGAGLTVDCGSDTDATFSYQNTGDRWTLNKPLHWTYATATTALSLNNNNITGVNKIFFADPGVNEGLEWSNIRIFESPNDLTNASGNFQVTYGGTRRLTVDNTGIDVNGNITLSGNIVDSDQNEIIDIDTNDIRFNGKHVQSAYGVWIRGESNNRKAGIDGSSSGTTLQFYVENAERARLNNSGNLGIGTTSPISKLDVAGDGKFRGTADGAPVLKLGQHDNSANTPLVTVYTDDGGSTRTFGGDSLEFNFSRYGQQIGASRGSAAGGNVRSWKFGTTTNGDERGVDLFIYSQGDSSATGSTGTSTNVQISATSNRNSYINTSGNFGLGTAAPATKLHLSSTSTSTLTVQNTTNAGNAALHFRDENNGDAYKVLYNLPYNTAEQHFNGNGLKFYSTQTSAEVAKIGFGNNYNTSYFAGRVGIGTTSPSQKLEVVGNAIISGSSDAGSNVALNIGGTGNSAIRTRHIEGKDFQSASAGALYLNHYHNSNIIMNNGGGKVGMGISTPQARLHIHHAGTASDSHAYAHFTTGDTGSASTDGLTIGVAADANAAINFRETSGALKIIAANELQFYSGGSERISINSSGSIEFNNAFRFPTSDGSANQVLKTDGSGNLAWATEAAVSANTSISDLDGDTKIQTEESADEDLIRFDAAGVERFRIGSDVMVIGTTDFNITGANRRLNFTSGTGTVRTTGASSLHLGTNSTNRVTIDSSGNVGIGTASPSQRLQVAGTILADTALTASSGTTAIGIGAESSINDGSSTYKTKLITDNNNGKLTTYQYGSYLTLKAGVEGTGYSNNWSKIELRDGGSSSGTTAHMKFYTSGDERMVINDGGNVGIGTSSPARQFHIENSNVGVPTTYGIGIIEAVDAQLDLISSSSGTWGSAINLVEGNGGSNTNVWSIVRQTSGGSGNSSLRFNFGTTNQHTNANKVTFTSAGSVGIGGSEGPGERLAVSGNTLVFGGGSNTAGGGGGTMFLGNSESSRHWGIRQDTSRNIHFDRYDSGWATRVTFLKSGNVGIGTTAPATPLHVAGTVRSQAQGSSAFADYKNQQIYVNSGPFNIAVNGKIRLADQNNNPVLTVDNANDRVGIGIDTPGATLHLQNSSTNSEVMRITTTGDNPDRHMYFQSDHIYSNGSLYWGTGNQRNLYRAYFHTFHYGGGNTEAMRIDTNGNVGIGTASPTAKLQVEELGIDTTTTTTSATTQVAIDTMAAATFRSAEFTIQVTNSTDSTYHLTKVLLIHDGTTPGITEYGTVFTGTAAEATFDADISSGNVRLLATPASTDSMTFKVVRHCITV